MAARKLGQKQKQTQTKTMEEVWRGDPAFAQQRQNKNIGKSERS